jgi:paraquat-inducible protein B
MSENVPSEGSTNDAPEVVVEKGRGFSPIWLIPIVAVIVAATLAYEAIQSRGPEIVVLFESAEGLEAGKSKVKYHEVEIGTVDLIRIRDPKTVEVHCSLAKGGSEYITKSAQFWVVRPRVGAGGISGLGTLVSSAYLTLRLGNTDDPRQRQFTGLETPRSAPPTSLAYGSPFTPTTWGASTLVPPCSSATSMWATSLATSSPRTGGPSTSSL